VGLRAKISDKARVLGGLLTCIHKGSDSKRGKTRLGIKPRWEEKKGRYMNSISCRIGYGPLIIIGLCVLSDAVVSGVSNGGTSRSKTPV